MSKEEFYKYCCNYFSPEYSSALSDLYMLFIDNDIGNLDIVVLDLISRENEIDSTAYPSLLIDAVVTKAIDVLLEEGVVLENSDYSNVLFFVGLLTAHFGIKNLEDKYWIKELIEEQDEDVSNVDLYYEILTGVNELGLENYYDYVIDVTHDLIDNILDSVSVDNDDEFHVENPLEKPEFTESFKRLYKSDDITSGIISAYFDVYSHDSFTIGDLVRDNFITSVYFEDASYSIEHLIVCAYIYLCRYDSEVTLENITNVSQDSPIVVLSKLACDVKNKDFSELFPSVIRLLKLKTENAINLNSVMP